MHGIDISSRAVHLYSGKRHGYGLFPGRRDTPPIYRQRDRSEKTTRSTQAINSLSLSLLFLCFPYLFHLALSRCPDRFASNRETKQLYKTLQFIRGNVISFNAFPIHFIPLLPVVKSVIVVSRASIGTLEKDKRAQMLKTAAEKRGLKKDNV